jgi:hypothetical protein
MRTIDAGDTDVIDVDFLAISDVIPPPEPPPVVEPIYQGYVDNVTCDGIWGWAWNANEPNTPISVSIHIDNIPAAVVLADQFRQDLVDNGIGNGNHGFSTLIPAQYKDGLPHMILVYASNSHILSNNSNASFICAPPTPLPPPTRIGPWPRKDVDKDKVLNQQWAERYRLSRVSIPGDVAEFEYVPE